MYDEDNPIIEDVVVEKTSEGLAKLLPSIFLVGPMGAGKTTIGKLLAKRLGREFIDCDHYIVAQTGADIPWIFAKEGEEGFRDRETRALEELTAMPNIVMATGGGAVGCEENRKLLQQGFVIYLEASVDTQLIRTKKDKNRPLLQNDNPRATLEALYQKRHPLYQEVATIIVPTGRAYPKQMVADLLEILAKYAKEHA
ncbi:shikimate kinase [Moraxella sp.]|uniref:shikimate kinase n=1 Tax=Moraxella sp. TaxID=479 RepID=UPI0026258638|nr:shikimate kinase [Moraxella sp.]MCP3896800.1 shikimate kinase [Moraxella sp.]